MTTTVPLFAAPDAPPTDARVGLRPADIAQAYRDNLALPGRGHDA